VRESSFHSQTHKNQFSLTEDAGIGATWASSVYSPAIVQISDEYHVSREVSLLGLSLLLVGYGQLD